MELNSQVAGLEAGRNAQKYKVTVSPRCTIDQYQCGLFHARGQVHAYASPGTISFFVCDKDTRPLACLHFSNG